MEHIFWSRIVDEVTPIHLASIREYFRRTSLWAKHLELANFWPVLQVSTIDGLRFNQKYVDHWSRHLGESSLPKTMKEHIYQFIHWRAILNPAAVATNLPDPFAPLHLFCSIGGRFDRDHSGSINLNAGSIPGYPMEYYLGKEPFLVNAEETTILIKSSLPGRIAELLNP